MRMCAAAALAAVMGFAPAVNGARPSDGGMVTRPASQAGVWFLDGQGRVEAAFVRKVADEIAAQLQLPVKVRAGGAEGVDGVSVSLEERADGDTLTVMPEGRRAKVNVRALAADGPPADRLESRVRKEMWRAAVYLLGGGNSEFRHCVMKPVASLGDLDDLEAASACPEPFNRVLATAAALGIRGARTTTYRRACEEGWAPQPVDDAQRAIWERVKADKERGPANAIRILPPNRRK